MAKLTTLLFGLGAGAGLMYLFDPQAGNRRRSDIRNQALGLRNRSDEALEAAAHDLRNRVQGVLTEASAAVSNEPASDWVLAERVRARLGTLTRHASAMQVDVRDKRVYLTGDVLSREADKIYAGVASVRGITGVENQLRIRQGPEGIQALQGDEQSRMHRNGSLWTPSTRLLAGVGGGVLVLYGAVRGGFIGRLINITGWGLAVRSATNIQLTNLLGMTEERKVIHIRKNIQIPAPVEEVYNFWSNYTNFPNFMSHVREVHDLGNGRSHWVINGPAGVPVEWDAVTTENIPNQVIAWESVPGAAVKSTGEVRFHRQDGGDATQVDVRMFYNPPAGAVGHAVAELFGSDPKTAMDDDLNKMKDLLAQERSGGQHQQRTTRAAGSQYGSPGGSSQGSE